MSRKSLGALMLGGWIVVGSTAGHSQVPAIQRYVGTAEVEVNKGALASALSAYGAGDWTKAQRETQALVGPLLLDLERKHELVAAPRLYVVVAKMTPPGAKDPELVRFLSGPAVFDPSDAARAVPYDSLLHGETSLLEVYLSTSSGDAITTDARVTRERSPLESQAIAFTKGINLGAFRSTVTTYSQHVDVGPWAPAKKERVVGQVRRYEWSPRRGTVTFKSLVTPGPRPAQERIDALAASREEMALGPARLSGCAAALADDLVALLSGAAEEKLCGGDATDSEAIEACVRKRARETVDANPTCQSELTSDPSLRSAQIAAVASVPATLLSAYAGREPKPVSGTATFANIPPTRTSFGLIAAAIGSEGGDERAKVNDDGLIVHDPLGGGITMATLNWHPVPYFTADDALSAAQRWRVFGAYTITPEPGLAAGVGFQLIRGLSIDAGVAWLRIKTPASGVAFGDSAADHEDGGLKHGHRRVVFFGFGYSLQ